MTLGTFCFRSMPSKHVLTWSKCSIEVSNRSFEFFRSRSSFPQTEHERSPFWLFRVKNLIKFNQNVRRQSQNPFFTEITQYKAIWHLFHRFLHSNCRMGVVYNFGNDKTHRNFRLFQKQTKHFKQTSLQKKGFWPSSSEIHILDYIDRSVSHTVFCYLPLRHERFLEKYFYGFVFKTEILLVPSTYRRQD